MFPLQSLGLFLLNERHDGQFTDASNNRVFYFSIQSRASRLWEFLSFWSWFSWEEKIYGKILVSLQIVCGTFRAKYRRRQPFSMPPSDLCTPIIWSLTILICSERFVRAASSRDHVNMRTLYTVPGVIRFPKKVTHWVLTHMHVQLQVTNFVGQYSQQEPLLAANPTTNNARGTTEQRRTFFMKVSIISLASSYIW